MNHVLLFDALPSLWPSYVRALASRKPALLPGGAIVPSIEARVAGVAAPARGLAAYRRVCGFPADGTLPLTYPRVLATPLHLALLTSDAFPLRVLGVVHVHERIASARPIGEGERLDVRVSLSGHVETERGQELELVTELRSGGELVWTEAAGFLARRRTARGARSAPPPDPGADEQEVLRLEVPAGVGRRYALASGDLNPIHLSRTTARLFGFPRPVAHGMWSLARVAATLGPRLDGPGPVALEASFKLPVLLPARLSLRARPAVDGLAFALRDAADARPHVTGTLARAATAPSTRAG
jgi:acyl dehydratase